MTPLEAQTTDRVLMVRPARFGANPQTARSNAFQRPVADGREAAVRAAAREEHPRFAGALADSGVEVHLFEDAPEPETPDAVFPNNWVSLHADGRAVLYPMLAPTRRLEVRPEWIAELAGRVGVAPWRTVDLTHLAEAGKALEGTGSLVLDRPGRVAYACRSPRTTRGALGAFAAELGYEPLPFDALDGAGVPIYHTNVCLALGDGFAVACLEAVPDAGARRALALRLAAGGREVIEISRDQMAGFAGNLLHLRATSGAGRIALSAAARAALDADQRRRIAAYGDLVSADLATIEAHGGGSARCMLAEVFPARS